MSSDEFEQVLRKYLAETNAAMILITENGGHVMQIIHGNAGTLRAIVKHAKVNPATQKAIKDIFYSDDDPASPDKFAN